MRLMLMHKTDSTPQGSKLPTSDIVAQMGAFIGEHARSGRLLGGDGLLPDGAARTRLTFRDGRCTLQHGPYAGANELPAAILKLEVATREAALGWAERYGKILGDGELELGAVTEAWDLGLSPRPDDAPLHFLLIEKADDAFEAKQPRSAKQKADLTRLRTEMSKARVLVSAEQLEPSAAAKRLRITNGELRVIDGPFAESKELIAGFAILALPSVDAAIPECQRYAEILGGTLEMDIRPLVEAAAEATA